MRILNLENHSIGIVLWLDVVLVTTCEKEYQLIAKKYYKKKVNKQECNCNNKEKCPLQGQCMQNNKAYRAEVTKLET